MRAAPFMVKPSAPALEPATRGRCRYCGCTDFHACSGGCAWADKEHTVCDNPRCLEKAENDGL